MDLVNILVHKSLSTFHPVSFHVYWIQLSSNHFLKASQCPPSISEGCDGSDPTLLLGGSQSGGGGRYWIEVTSWGRGCVTGESPRPVSRKGTPHTVGSLHPGNLFPKSQPSPVFLLFCHTGAPASFAASSPRSPISKVGGVGSAHLFLETLAWWWPSLGLRILTWEI